MAVSIAVKLRTTTLALATFLLVAVFALDHRAGSQFDLWLMYILPIGLVSIVLGPLYGYVIAIVATGLLLLDSVFAGDVYGSVAALLFARVSILLAYLLFVFLIGLARGSISDNRHLRDSQLPPGRE